MHLPRKGLESSALISVEMGRLLMELDNIYEYDADLNSQKLVL